MNGLVCTLLRYSGAAWLWRETIQRGKVTILLFHDIEPSAAERCFAYLERHYNIIGLADYLAGREGQRSLPPKAAVITFDDGHAGNYALLPVIKKHHLPVTIFLCSDIVGSRRHFWFKPSGGTAIDIESMKLLDNNERIETLNRHGLRQEAEYADYQALQDWQIEEMKPWVDFQSHTCTHPILPRCSDETAEREVADSKKNLEGRYGLRIYALAYPNGDYSARDIAKAQASGYRCGLTVDAGYNDLHSDLFRLRRLSVGDARKGTTELMVKASGLYVLLKHWVRHPDYGYKENTE